MLIFVSGCKEEGLSPIDNHQSFVASVNILQPSVTFYDSLGGKLATWTFEKAYTGAILLEQDRIILYGHQLTEADMYELSSGKKLKSIKTGLGTTNAYYDKEQELLFITNSEDNSILSYDKHGNQLKELKLRNYPMGMASYKGKIYVTNFKDTVLTVIDMEELKMLEEWDIDKSSSSLLIVPEKNTIWIGGHGEGSRPNQTVKILDLKTGELLDKIKVSFMPVGFIRNEEEVYIVNHGSNELFAANLSGDILWQAEVGANPFAVETINEKIVVAGFDDHTLYFIKDGKIEKTIETDNGPFQLLVREVE